MKEMLLAAVAYKWVMFNCANYDNLPMINIGKDADSKDLYVGRVLFGGDMLPAKVKPDVCTAWTSIRGKEHKTKNFEVLVPYTFEWVGAKNGQVPSNAVPGGQTVSGETLYVGRVQHNGVTLGGKVHSSQGKMYAPHNGAEIHFTEYEVLVQT